MTRPRHVDVYIATVAALAAAAFGYVILIAHATPIDPAMFTLLLLLAAATQRVPIFLFRSSAVSVSFAATIGAYVLYGTGAALITQLICAAVNSVTPRKPARKVIFNTGALTLAGFLAASTYDLAGGATAAGDIPRIIAAVAVSGAVYFLATTSLTAMVIALSSGASFLAVWRENYAWMVVNFLATSVNGASLAIAYHTLGFFGALIFVLPLGVAWFSFRMYMSRSLDVRRRNEELQHLNEKLRTANESLEHSALSVIEVLVSALEARVEDARGHSAATMARAVATGRRMGLGEEELMAVRLGALIHDVGKIGVSPGILRKGARLNESEWEELRKHPVLGAQLLSQIPALEVARPVVLAHHERYDGTGYPRGLKGAEIPLTAQIVSVADAFDAITAGRPYRAARSPEEAVRELRSASGTQFNPAVVEAFTAAVGEPSPLAAPAHGHARPSTANAQ